LEIDIQTVQAISYEWSVTNRTSMLMCIDLLLCVVEFRLQVWTAEGQHDAAVVQHGTSELQHSVSQRH